MLETVGILQSGEVRVVERQEARAAPGVLVDAYEGQNHDAFLPPHELHSIRATDALLIRLKGAYLLNLPRLDGVVVTADGRLVAETGMFSDQIGTLTDFSALAAQAIPLAQPVFSGVDANWFNYAHWSTLGLGRMGVADAYLPNDCEIVAPAYGLHPETLTPRHYSGDIHAGSLRGMEFMHPVRLLTPGIYRTSELFLLWTNSGQPAHVTCLQSLYRPFNRCSQRFQVGGRRRIFIERRNDPRMTLEQAQILRGLAAQHQFETVQLEDYSFDDEVALFANTSHIVASHGAGLTNIIYAPPQVRILELNSELDGNGSLRPWIYLLAQGGRQRYSYLNGSRGDFTPERLRTAFERLLT